MLSNSLILLSRKYTTLVDFDLTYVQPASCNPSVHTSIESVPSTVSQRALQSTLALFAQWMCSLHAINGVFCFLSANTALHSYRAMIRGGGNWTRLVRETSIPCDQGCSFFFTPLAVSSRTMSRRLIHSTLDFGPHHQHIQDFVGTAEQAISPALLINACLLLAFSVRAC